jgi:uncharacterized membrane protein YccC
MQVSGDRRRIRVVPVRADDERRQLGLATAIAAATGESIALAIVALLILMHDPLPALIGVGIVLCGWPLHKFLASRKGVPVHGTYTSS